MSPSTRAPRPPPTASPRPEVLDASPKGLLPPGLRWLGRALEPLYRAEVGRRNRRYDAGIGVRRLAVPVLSVGNLSLGGTGKTPMVLRIVEELKARGHRPCVALRGYAPGRLTREGSDAGRRSDEARLYHERLGDVPVAVGADRFTTLSRMLAEMPSATGGGLAAFDCVVLDDGFQHRQLHRDLDIVLIDASAASLRDCLVPAGRLREPWSSLRRAHACVITHAELAGPQQVEDLRAGIAAAGMRGPVAVASHVWAALRVREPDGVERVETPGSLRGTCVLGLCAIGNPAAFARALRSEVGASNANADPTPVLALRDHHPFDAATVARVQRDAAAARAEMIVCTEKDWVKLETTWARDRWACPIARVELRLSFERGERELMDLVAAAAGRPDERRPGSRRLTGPG